MSDNGVKPGKSPPHQPAPHEPAPDTPAPDASKAGGVAMDTPGERRIVPAAKHRLRGADRSGLGDRGWSEVSADNVGDPDDSNVPPAYYEPASESDPPDQPV